MYLNVLIWMYIHSHLFHRGNFHVKIVVHWCNQECNSLFPLMLVLLKYGRKRWVVYNITFLSYMLFSLSHFDFILSPWTHRWTNHFFCRVFSSLLTLLLIQLRANCTSHQVVCRLCHFVLGFARVFTLHQALHNNIALCTIFRNRTCLKKSEKIYTSIWTNLGNWIIMYLQNPVLTTSSFPKIGRGTRKVIF